MPGGTAGALRRANAVVDEVTLGLRGKGRQIGGQGLFVGCKAPNRRSSNTGTGWPRPCTSQTTLGTMSSSIIGTAWSVAWRRH